MAKENLLTFVDLLQTTTSYFLKKKSQLDLAININGDEIGSLTGRLGYAQVGTTLSAGNTVRGLRSYQRQADGTQYLFAVCNGTLSYYNGSSVSNITSGLTSAALVEFRVFVDELFMVGADSSNNYLTPANIDGTTYSTTNNLGSAPSGARFVEVFRNKLYFADVVVGGTRYPSRFNFSSIPTTGAITWSSTDFEEVYTDNGEAIKGMHTNKFLNQLLFFKETTMHAWDTFRLRDVGNVGTTAHRSIVTVDGVTYFFNRNGIYAYDGSMPKLISRPISKWIKGITASNLGSVFAAKESEFVYKLYVGAITVDGVSYSNCEIRHSVLDNTFTIYSYAHAFSVYAEHIISSVERVYSGDTTGKIFKLAQDADAVYSDDGSAIGNQFSFTVDMGLPSERKFIDRCLIYTTRGQNLTGRVRVRNEDWKTHFAINKAEQQVNINPKDGRFLQFHFSSNSTVMPFIFEGVSFNANQTTSNIA